MKKLFLSLVFLTVVAVWFGLVASSHADATGSRAAFVSPNLVISQFQAGGNVNADDEFIEIHNIGSTAVDLNGYRVVYRSASGTTDVGPLAEWTNPILLQPGQSYLIASTSYTGTVTPNLTYNNAACACSMAAGQGGLAIRQGAQNSGTIIDAVGWGTASNIFFEGTRTTAAGNSNSKARLLQGCQDTDNNVNDFATLSPSAPRNTASPLNVCNGGGTTLFAAMSANPSTVTPPGNTLLTVSVIPATTPPSTGINVTGDLTNIGGGASQIFFDNGTNGDVTSGDNIYSYLATLATGTPGGIQNVTAVASDAQARSVNVSQNITVSAPVPGEDPLLFGNPSNATGDIANENNYLMVKPQYSLSYSRAKATPNWVAWRIDSTWITGAADRQDDYRPDPALPSNWYHVQDSDYSGSGYDRGHICPSGDRTRSVSDNSATFLMTNFVPQLAANNQGPWNDFEIYLRTLASQGNEIYVISGPSGNIGTISSGRIVVPLATWKVVLVLPNGSDDLRRTSRSTRVFGIIVPNQPPLNGTPWRNYRVTVDAVEYLTGYNFFDQIPKITQELIERRRDKQ